MKLHLLLGLCIGLLLTACASRRTDILIPPMEESAAMTELIDMEVSLSKDQRPKVRELVTENAGVKVRITEQYRGRPVELSDAQKARLQKLDRQMQAVLHEDQIKSWKTLYREIYRVEMEEHEKIQPGDGYQRQDEFNRPGY